MAGWKKLSGGVMPTIDPALEAWCEERDRVAQRVDLWFRQATNRLAAPSDKGCRNVAFYIMAFRDRVDDKTLDTRKQAIKHGKLFLKYIAPERRRIEEMVILAARGRPFGNWFEEYQELLFRIDEAGRHIEAVLPALSPKRDAKPAPIRRLASCAQEAWAETNGGRAPHSKNPDDPLCRFLVPALAETGLRLSPAAISDILRFRRRKPKDGQNRN
jgi:hypothetical protein